MRLQIFSDIHIDVVDGFEPRLEPGVDVVVVAGDVCEGFDRGMRWLRTHLGGEVAIVLVAGNHEYFRRVRSAERIAGAAAACEHRIAYLDDAELVLGGVRFIGSTLWADYELYGADRRDEMMEIARRRMMDHRRILEAPDRYLTPEDSLTLHQTSRAWLTRCLATPHDGPTVVVTHHGPHPSSLANRYREDLLSAAFISDLSAFIERHAPALWVHGHTHVGLDYQVGPTRIVCNPRGYGSENPAFNPALVIDV
jgi:Icc-related predicted phosphoesterase